MIGHSEKIELFFKIIKNTKEFAYDIESNGLKWQNGFVCGYSVSDGERSVYIPVRHGGGANIERVEEFERELNKAFSEHTGKIVTFNGKFDMHFSENHGVHIGNKLVDCMVMACLLDENRRWFTLASVAKGYNIAQKKGDILYQHIAQKFNLKADRNVMGHYWRLAGDDPIAVEYAEYDTLVTKQLWDCQKRDLYAQELDVVQHMENELSYVLQKMERRGIGVDPEERIKVCDEIESMFVKAYAKIPVNEVDLTPINIRSGKDLKEYFELCDIDDWPTTEKGNPSFPSKWLATSDEGRDILDARKLAHLKSSFLDNLDDHVYNNRIHTTFNQAKGETHGTRGGRLSSSNPNKQQVPKRDKVLGRIYRRMFKARPGYVICEFDYSQAEPRLYTHYSGEPTLVKGYTSTPYVDMHSVAAQYMNVDRGIAKNLNLGIMYTMGPRKLAAQLGIEYAEALAIFKRWHRTFPLVSEFTKKAERVAQDRGYVKTILGRRRRFPDIKFCYRAANSIVQGGSSDIMKWKLIELDRYFRENNIENDVIMLLTIHDSVVFEIREDMFEHYRLIIEHILCDVQSAPFNLRIPFLVDHGKGKDWSIASYGD